MAAITVGQKDVADIYEEFANSIKIKSDITVEFSDLKNPDVLDILRLMERKPTTEELIAITETMCDGCKITFAIGEQVLKSIVYNKGTGNSIALMLTEEVYLLDILTSTIYALLLKKLTPHLENSN